jgi:2-polyprenyl-3-methyl-5-hydroxy-6-metoxy-1,4-benzoquinol methylase
MTLLPMREDGSVVLAPSWRQPVSEPVPAVDLADLNSPHTLAVLSIRPGATVLDVGCGRGIVAAALSARGCRVWGVEIDPRHAEIARQHCVTVVDADLETLDFSGPFRGASFDAILFLDVLEHLRDPAAVLARATTALAPGGQVVLSIPNVTHGALRLELLRGTFRYRESGLLDRGHLRFFDAAAVDELVRHAGLRTQSKLRIIRRLDQTEFDLDLGAIPDAIHSLLESDPDALTYQFFVIAEPGSGGASAPSAGATLVERQHARIDELTRTLDRGTGYARHLEAELDRQRTAAEELAQAVEREAGTAADLQREVAARVARIGELEETCATLSRLETDVQAHLQHVEGEIRRREEDIAARDARIGELEETCASLKRVSADAEAYVPHLERELERRVREIAVRDDAMIELRTRAEEAARSVDALAAEVVARDDHIARLQVAHEAQLHQVQAEHTNARRHFEQAATDAGAEVAVLRELLRQPRHRLAERGNDSLKRALPLVHRLARRVAAPRSRNPRPAVLESAAAVTPPQHGVRPDYVARESARYFTDAPDGYVYQPDVYRLAGTLAHLGGATCLVDIGCGRAEKLVQAAEAHGLTPIGLDYGENLARCRAEYPQGSWLEVNLERPVGPIIPDHILRDAVVVCGDVIEHLTDPTNLLAFLRACMCAARVGLLTTPERDRTRGPDHAGPPPNPAHVREWNARELKAYLEDNGLTVTFAGLTRSHDRWDAMQTVLVMLGRTRGQ